MRSEGQSHKWLTASNFSHLLAEPGQVRAEISVGSLGLPLRELGTSGGSHGVGKVVGFVNEEDGAL